MVKPFDAGAPCALALHVELVHPADDLRLQVDFLLVLHTEQVVIGLAGDGQYGRTVHLGVVKTVQEVNSAGAGGGQADAEPAVMGTIGYMSPEQVRGENVTTGTDVYSLGVVLYELLLRRKPFPADTVFLKSRDGVYDMTIALYHDQGLMAVKLVGFGRVVTLLIGASAVFGELQDALNRIWRAPVPRHDGRYQEESLTQPPESFSKASALAPILGALTGNSSWIPSLRALQSANQGQF